MTRRRRIAKALLGVFLAVVIGLVWAAWPGRWTFTVSPETTYVTGPLEKDGSVDYVSALNERLRGDITPDTNANVLIWQALGPRPEGGEMPPEYFRWLGIDPPPAEGEYFIDFLKFMKQRDPEQYQQRREELQELHTRYVRTPWSAANEPDLAAWLKRNEKPLELIYQASRRPHYYNPLVPRRTEDWSPSLVGALLPTVQKCREIVVVLCTRAMLRTKERKIDEAWKDLITSHRLSRVMARGGCIIEYLVAVAIDQVTVNATVAFLQHADLTTERIRECEQDLTKLPPMSPIADVMDRGDRFMMLDAMMQVIRQASLDIFSDQARRSGQRWYEKLFRNSVDWDPAFRNGNDWFDRYVAACRIPDRETRQIEFARLNAELTALKQQTSNLGPFEKLVLGPDGRGEHIGNILIILLSPALEKNRGAEDRHEQTQRNLRLAFALAAYRRDHQSYPHSLAELAPKYIDSIPDDLFTSKPLVYRREGNGYVLYSLGPNKIDEDGHGHGDEPRGDDVGFRVPVPPPPVNEKD